MEHEKSLNQCQPSLYVGETLPNAAKFASTLQSQRNARQLHEHDEAMGRIDVLLQDRPGDEQLLFTLLERMERIGGYPDMDKNWEKMCQLFPDNEACFRMHLRWMRRQKRVPEGLALIDMRYLERKSHEAPAVGYLCGLRELKLSEASDAFFGELDARLKALSSIQIAYMRNLFDVKRYAAAAAVAEAIAPNAALVETERDSIATVLRYGAISDRLEQSDWTTATTYLAAQYVNRSMPSENTDHIGKVMFYTSQLSIGGAERQFVRMAAALDDALKQGQKINGKTPGTDVNLAVRRSEMDEDDTNFFLPYLYEAGFDVRILEAMPEASVRNPFEHLGEAGDVFYLLPKKLRQNVSKLAEVYRKDKTQTAYIWQDFGIRVAGLAALAAGVPRIILCFRSTPLSIRKEFDVPEYDGYYKALSRVPGTFVACNSQNRAADYANWLDIPEQEVSVVQNSATTHPPEGEPADIEFWETICAASPGCHKTVLGVFRLHPVKRADVFVELAQKYIARDPEVRFVIIGTGKDHERAAQHIIDLGLQDRVFLAGSRAAVGYWLGLADVVLHTALYEGLPNAILEAQLAGRPVITTPAGGTSEAFIHGQSGICLSRVEPFPYDEALEALETLLSDADMRERFGQVGRAFVTENFTMQASLRKTVDLLSRSWGGPTT